MAALSSEQIGELRAAFDAFDTDQSGSIDASELGQAMKIMGKHMSERDLKEIIDKVDDDGKLSVFNLGLFLMSEANV